jgi:copper resistance protein C
MKKTLIGALLCVALAVPLPALAHSVLVSSQPTANGTVSAKGFDVELKFDSRVDFARSRLTMESADGKKMVLKTAQGGGKGTVIAHAEGVPAGPCRLIFEVLSVDGHIARGVVPFTITAE